MYTTNLLPCQAKRAVIPINIKYNRIIGPLKISTTQSQQKDHYGARNHNQCYTEQLEDYGKVNIAKNVGYKVHFFS